MRSLTTHGKKVGTDLCEFRKSHYPVVVNYYFKYPEVCFMGKQDPTSSQVIAYLKSVCARHGIPKILYQTMVLSLLSVKSLFKKAHKANEDPYLALLNHRATSNNTDGLSPAKKLCISQFQA